MVFLFWDVKTVFYALWSPFTFIMGYSDPRKPTDDKLKGTEWQCSHSGGKKIPLVPVSWCLGHCDPWVLQSHLAVAYTLTTFVQSGTSGAPWTATSGSMA